MLVSSHLVNADKFTRALRSTSPRENVKIVSDLLRTLAFNTQSIAAQKKIIRGGSGPAVKGKLTSRTGTGRRSIGVDLSGAPRFAEVGSSLGYMALHETGGRVNIPRKFVKGHFRTQAFGKTFDRFRVKGFFVNPHKANFPPRPWLAPAVKDALKNAPNIAVKIWEQHSRGD